MDLKNINNIDELVKKAEESMRLSDEQKQEIINIYNIEVENAQNKGLGLATAFHKIVSYVKQLLNTNSGQIALQAMDIVLGTNPVYSTFRSIMASNSDRIKYSNDAEDIVDQLLEIENEEEVIEEQYMSIEDKERALLQELKELIYS